MEDVSTMDYYCQCQYYSGTIIFVFVFYLIIISDRNRKDRDVNGHNLT